MNYLGAHPARPRNCTVELAGMAKMRIRLLLALAVLVLGLLFQMRACGCSFPTVGRESISIQRVRHGTLQIPVPDSGATPPAESHPRAGIEFAQVENAGS